MDATAIGAKVLVSPPRGQTGLSLRPLSKVSSEAINTQAHRGQNDGKRSPQNEADPLRMIQCDNTLALKTTFGMFILPSTFSGWKPSGI